MTDPATRFATAFVLFSLLVNGTTLRWVIRMLGIDRLSPQNQALQWQAVHLATTEVLGRMAETARTFHLPEEIARQAAAEYRTGMEAGLAQEDFDRLFPGGEGRLVLTDPDDMLTTGIEIEARPAGKKVKRLSLLSGGERSLAAVALLVAIFKARPSPFYVMDEVEAALDDTNLGRLLEIFTELRRSSQLIIITHQKRTMEVADALYGITMRDGVTKAVSQRLAQPDRGTAVTPDV